MSLKDWYNAKDPKSQKTIKIVAGFILLVLFALVLSQCTAPAKAQFVGNSPMVGRSPEPVHIVSLTVETTEGRRVDSMQVAVLPPIGYLFTDRRGTTWEIVGGEFGPPSCSSTRCAIRATAFVTAN